MIPFDIDKIEIVAADIASNNFNYLDKIIIAFNQRGFPFPKTEYSNALFIFAEPVDSKISSFINRSNELDMYWTMQEVMQGTMVVRIHYTYYGSYAYEDVMKAKYMWYTNAVQSVLKENNMYTIPGKDIGPVRLMEQTNGQWFARYDISFLVYVTTQYSTEYEYYDNYKVEIKENR